MQICIHKVKYKINVSIIFSSDNILKADDILMTVKFLQKYDFSESSLCVCCVLESIKAFL